MPRPLDAEVHGHGDLHGRDARAVPQAGQRDVGEPQVLQPEYRLLAEEVVDAQDLALGQQPVQPGVQVAGRGQVVPERLLDRDPAVAQQPGRAEVLHDGAKQRRRHLQVVHRPPPGADRRGQPPVLGLLDGTQQGQGRLLLVGGEPGTGKSLLLARAGEEAGRRGFRVVAAAAQTT
jgi:hypothetical protein